MTPFGEIVYMGPGDIIRVCSLLLSFIQLFLVISAFRLHRSTVYKSFALTHFLVGFFILLVMMDGTFQPEQVHSRIVMKAYEVPAAFFAALQMISFIILAVFGADLWKYAKNHLNEGAVKETIDLLPAGICFGEEKGTAAMVNVRMNELSREKTGHRLRNTEEFWIKIKEQAKEAKDEGSSGKLLLVDGETAWLFEKGAVEADHEKYEQIIATDISERYRLTRELEDKNVRLKEMQRRLSAYSAETDKIIISQEILNAKATIHDEVGQVLLTAKYYMDHPERMNEEALLHVLRQSNAYLLKEAEEDDLKRDRCWEALQMAETIGIKVIQNGSAPSGRRERDILGAAVRECAANTAKHAMGDQLYLDISRENGKLVFVLTNNGRPPQGTLREAGGLLSLRKMTEEAGGEMTVESQPFFRLTIKIIDQDDTFG